MTLFYYLDIYTVYYKCLKKIPYDVLLLKLILAMAFHFQSHVQSNLDFFYI